MYADRLIGPWYECVRSAYVYLRIADAHTHVGDNDSDGFRCSASDLLSALELADAHAAVFPMREPEGYRHANRAVIAHAQRSGGRLSAFCRVDPRQDPVAEAEHWLDAGAVGIKLHPFAERFDLLHAAIDGLFALADERRVPVLVHAGSNIPPLGARLLELCDRHPGTPVILAHAGVSDANWILPEAEQHPNLFFDLSWWDTSAILTVLATVPPGQILHASDTPYGTPVTAALCTVRCCIQAGLSDDQVRSVMGEQFDRLLARAAPRPAGRAPGDAGRIVHTPLTRTLGLALAQLICGGSPKRHLARALALCGTAGDLPLDWSLRALLYEAARSDSRASVCQLLIAARTVALTPAAPLPDPVAIHSTERTTVETA